MIMLYLAYLTEFFDNYLHSSSSSIGVTPRVCLAYEARLFVYILTNLASINSLSKTILGHPSTSEIPVVIYRKRDELSNSYRYVPLLVTSL